VLLVFIDRVQEVLSCLEGLWDSSKEPSLR